MAFTAANGSNISGVLGSEKIGAGAGSGVGALAATGMRPDGGPAGVGASGVVSAGEFRK